MKPNWEIIADAQSYLAYSLTDRHGKCVPDMPDRVNSYHDLAWLQDKLVNGAGRCANQTTDHFQVATTCERPSVAFCFFCGTELCVNHVHRSRGMAACEWCASERVTVSEMWTKDGKFYKIGDGPWTPTPHWHGKKPFVVFGEPND